MKTLPFFALPLKRLPALLLLLLWIGCASLLKQDQSLPPNYTYATVKEPYIFMSHGNSHTLLEYVHNRQSFYARTSFLPCLNVVRGEKFAILFDASNPDKYRVLWNSPVFFEGEETAKTTCTITHTSKKSTVVSFEYSAMYNGKLIRFQKCQVLNKEAANYPSLQKGASFEVEYWVSNPQRAILKVDTAYISIVR